jgi:hypothetical protein
MEINPYQAPTEIATGLAAEPAGAGGPPTRPVGIWILSGLHLLAGLLFLAALGLFVSQRRSLEIADGVMASLFWFVAVMCGFLAAVALSSGVGMWLGARWGWWIASFYYVWAVLGVVADFLLTMSQISQFDPLNIAIGLAGKLVQLVIHALILAYLFKRNVRAFFRLQTLRVDRALFRS